MSEDTWWKAILWSCSDCHAVVEVDDEIWIVPQIPLKSKWKIYIFRHNLNSNLPPPPTYLSHSFGPGTFALNSHTYKRRFEKIVDLPLPSLQSALAERVTRLSTHMNCLLQTDSLTLTQCHKACTFISFLNVYRSIPYYSLPVATGSADKGTRHCLMRTRMSLVNHGSYSD